MAPSKADDSSRTVAHLFNIMEAWRHLPGYRLEGRLAPFFDLFLLDVLGECLKDELHPIGLHPLVIPEFPLRIGTLYGEDELARMRTEQGRAPGGNQSYNVDYVAFSEDCKTAFLIELKTDMDSIDDDQKTYLRRAREKMLGPLVGGIVDICRSKGTRKRSKYVHLLQLLASLDLVEIPHREELYRKTFPVPRSGWSDAFREVEPTVEGKLESTQVIYIQPRKLNRESDKGEPGQDFKFICFEEVADVVQRFGDLGCIFANYLRQWTEDPGRQAPRKATDRP